MSKWIILLGGKRDGIELQITVSEEPMKFIHIPATGELEDGKPMPVNTSMRPQELSEAFDLYEFRGELRDRDPNARIYVHAGRYD